MDQNVWYTYQEFTDVGTRLYIAPELSIQSSGGPLNLLKKDKKIKNKLVAPRTTAKADMYSLGVSTALLRALVTLLTRPLDCVLRDELLLQDRLGTQQGYP